MATVLSPPEGLVRLSVCWDTYERLLADHENNSSVRFTYDQGELEILVPSPEHEMSSKRIEHLLMLLAEEWGLDFEGLGCTTFRREDLKKGFEADSSFYFQSAARIRGKKRLDLNIDPPPELIVEIDVTSSSMNKFLIYAAIGVPEVWRQSAGELSIFTLERNHYVQRRESSTFPNVTAADLTELVQAGLELERPIWIKRVRAWARAAHP